MALQPFLALVALAGGLELSEVESHEPVGLRIVVDGETVFDEPLTDGGGPPGFLALTGSTSKANWTVSWSFEIDPDPTELLVFEGAFEIDNFDTFERSFDIQLNVPVCPVIVGPTEIHAEAEVSLRTNGNGGRLSCFESPSLWRMLADGESVAELIYAPFFLSITGAGLAATSEDFGLSQPEAGPEAAHTIGVQHVFDLTDGEQATIATSFGLTAELSSLVDCVGNGDINNDGVVDFNDLILLIAMWGECGGKCAGDLDGNGAVDLQDLVILLSQM